MREAQALLDAERLTADAVAFDRYASDARCDAEALDRVAGGNGAHRRAQAERFARVADLCATLASYGDGVLDALADGSAQHMVHARREADRRRRGLGGGR